MVAALSLFAAPLTQVDAQRSTRGGSVGPSPGSGSRVAPAPAPSPAPAPRASVPAPAPRVSSPAPAAPRVSSPAPAAPRVSSPSPSAAPRASSPAPAAPRVSSPSPSAAPSRGATPAPDTSARPNRDDNLSRSTYRSEPTVPRTASGVPRIEPDRVSRDNSLPRSTGVSREATPPRGTGISRADDLRRTAGRDTLPAASGRGVTGSAGVARDSLRASSGVTPTAVDSSRATASITQRSTLSDFRTVSAGTSRDNLQPQEMVAPPTPLIHYGYVGAYYSGYHRHHHHSWGFRWSLGGGWSIGFSSGWYTGWCGWNWGWGRHIYHGPFATAILVGTAWHIVAHHGFWGWYGGSSCYWLPHWHWRTCDTFYYGGHYCRVNRPYWLGYTRWYDYRPYRYGYTTLVYDNLYDDGYEDGYERGYNRGYHDGADDASGLKDDRRRDSIGKPARPRGPDASSDRARGNVTAEYRHEMSRGLNAFEKGDYAQATKAFKEAAILDPQSADARYMLAVAAMSEGKYAFGAFALRRGMALDAKGSNLDLGKLFGGPDAVRAQRDALARDLSRAPDDPDLLLLHGYVALRSGDAREAANALDRALQHSPQDTAARELHKQALEALENS
ncbi:MAG: tetratricopeptide repeat protein [Planctomycetes bacterium]|nr:tetratricopeptide repeat protein [Planctomycetota bacterium]